MSSHQKFALDEYYFHNMIIICLAFIVILIIRYIMIFYAETTSELFINKLSACSSPVEGGREIILLCDKVVKGKQQSFKNT